jgi:hypothetical protein
LINLSTWADVQAVVSDIIGLASDPGVAKLLADIRTLIVKFKAGTAE